MYRNNEKIYEETYDKPKRPIELTFVRNSPPSTELRKDQKIPEFPTTSRSNSFLSPKSSRVTDLKQALINLQIGGDGDQTTGIVVSTQERPKRKVAAQTQYPFDFNGAKGESGLNSPFSQYMNDLSSPSSAKN